ncbi:beta-ketoacyl-[acyl-carrier-protein] synthase family protein [Streptomyces montanus]|uniref:Beta-ketoacyl-[acyl-carrier-protein] synthase family protein n=1 Tax=Streptomyces montanus TaxID=2580423 RepID=A0A5R9FZ91_9ACTN|nr:beta-ketoacyl-[acyl-carrier-protein] synthase family protein [Streptomyces montanus]TLS47346.1 beta-ketoacyl-[acyl-carrier-protein] synthase family protein [Streptomyces montanus]
MSGNGRQVVISGIGLLTALGEGPETNWKALLEGHSGIRPIQEYDTSHLQTRLGAEIDGFDPARFASRRQLNTMNRGDQLGLAAATLALRDAGIDTSNELGGRTGLFLGGNKSMGRMGQLISGLRAVRRPDGTPDMKLLGETADTIMPPLFFVEGLQPGAVFHVSQTFGIRGVNAFFAGTADAGATAIARAARAIRRGEADRIVAGGYDDATSWWSMTHLDRIGVLTTRNELGAAAFRPYDQNRSGAVLGEGGAVLVLEEKEAARARGARIYAEVSGVGNGHDARTPPATDPQGRGLTRAVRRALDDARLNPADLGYIASHGAATKIGDRSETAALRTVLGEASRSVPVSCVKPQTGHLVGGAGALNVVFSALALHHGDIPATAHLESPDAACDMDLVRGDARTAAHPATALALARGIEGQAVALALSRPA